METNLEKNTLYHIYNRGNWKQRIFIDDEDHQNFKDILQMCFSSYHFDLLAICIMQNHYHLVISQKGRRHISECMFRVGLLYAKYFNQKYDTVGHVFQGSFKSKAVLGPIYFSRLIEYISDNPTNAGLTNKEDYKWLYKNEVLINFYSLDFKTRDEFPEEEETDSDINFI